MSEVADALRQGVETCEKALSGELLPPQVDAWDLWRLLSGAWERLQGTEDHVLYASLLRMIVATVRLQCRWLRYEADELYVDSDIARDKIRSLPTRTLNTLFIKSFHPLVELEAVTEGAMRMGKAHWDELPSAGRREEAPLDRFLSFGADSDAARQVVREIPFEHMLDALAAELAARGDQPGISYKDFITRSGRAEFPEMVSRSYLVSFLVSQGRLELEPDGEDARIVEASGGPRLRSQSLAVIVRRAGRDDADAVAR